MLGRFYAICNCCSCCCGATEARRNGTPMLASSGYVAQVDEDLCAACGECAGVCQFTAISVDDGFARIDAAMCMGCGVCAAHCAQEAISLVRDPAKGEPLEIQKLIVQAGQLAEASSV
jgi:heterodisulfide reductase subunit A-like polyferredoxin